MISLFSNIPFFYLETYPTPHHEGIFVRRMGLVIFFEKAGNFYQQECEIYLKKRYWQNIFRHPIHCFPNIRIYRTITVSTAGITGEACGLKPTRICIMLEIRASAEVSWASSSPLPKVKNQIGIVATELY